MRYPGVYSAKNEIATENFAKGFQVYGEMLVKQGNKELERQMVVEVER